jgi:hypothetical protein
LSVQCWGPVGSLSPWESMSTPEEFVDIVKRHDRFVRGMVGGRRADLRFQNLANLRLPRINFQNAALAGANLS